MTHRQDRRQADNSNRAGLLAGLPVAERRLWVAGISTAILEGGSGSPLVLLHGEVASGGVVWGPVLAQLARGHRLVIPGSLNWLLQLALGRVLGLESSSSGFGVAGC